MDWRQRPVVLTVPITGFFSVDTVYGYCFMLIMVMDLRFLHFVLELKQFRVDRYV